MVRSSEVGYVCWCVDGFVIWSSELLNRVYTGRVSE